MAYFDPTYFALTYFETVDPVTVSSAPTLTGLLSGSATLDVDTVFTSDITGLDDGTHYYVRAYATNASGTSYGSAQEFTTILDIVAQGAATLTGLLSGAASLTYAPQAITATSAPTLTGVLSGSATLAETNTVSGSSTLTGMLSGSATLAEGFSASSGPTLTGLLSGSATLGNAPPITASGASTLTGLLSGAATLQEAFSATSTPTLTGMVSASATLWNASPIALTSAPTLTGLLSGSATATEGFILSGSSTLTGVLSGSASLWQAEVRTFTAASTLTGLLSGAATLAQALADTTFSAASTLTGLLSGAAELEAVLSFVSQLTGLDDGEHYYVRAYAMNESGTAYGDAEEFDTVLDTVVSGASALTGRLSGAATLQAVSGTTFVSQLTGLQRATHYYVRAYARNTAGVSYGNQRELTTLASVSVSGASTLTGRLSGSATLVKTFQEFPFVSELTDILRPETHYHLRAYAINAAGVSYGAERTFDTEVGVYINGASTLTQTGAATVVVQGGSTLTGMVSGAATIDNLREAPRSISAASTLTSSIAGSASVVLIAIDHQTYITAGSDLTMVVESGGTLVRVLPPHYDILSDPVLTAVVSSTAKLNTHGTGKGLPGGVIKTVAGLRREAMPGQVRRTTAMVRRGPWKATQIPAPVSGGVVDEAFQNDAFQEDAFDMGAQTPESPLASPGPPPSYLRKDASLVKRGRSK